MIKWFCFLTMLVILGIVLPGLIVILGLLICIYCQPRCHRDTITETRNRFTRYINGTRDRLVNVKIRTINFCGQLCSAGEFDQLHEDSNNYSEEDDNDEQPIPRSPPPAYDDTQPQVRTINNNSNNNNSNNNNNFQHNSSLYLSYFILLRLYF